MNSKDCQRDNKIGSHYNVFHIHLKILYNVKKHAYTIIKKNSFSPNPAGYTSSLKTLLTCGGPQICWLNIK